MGIRAISQAGQPAVVPGFENIHRAWHREHRCWVARILPGEFYVTCSREAITTVLGSCVSACIRDPDLGIGGMNHFMLPEDTTNGESSWMRPELCNGTRYGSFAMEKLINGVLKLGARRDCLEFKLFGGGRILSSMTDVGARNIAFVRNFMQLEGFHAHAEDLGDECPRRVVYFPETGRILLKRLRSMENRNIATREQHYLKKLDKEPAAADIELF